MSENDTKDETEWPAAVKIVHQILINQERVIEAARYVVNNYNSMLHYEPLEIRNTVKRQLPSLLTLKRRLEEYDKKN